MNLDWTAIRPLNGSQAAGFEELCAQLARAESPAGAKFERKGTPDAGVECRTVLGEKRIIGREANRNYQGALHISGAYTLGNDGPDGFLKFRRDRLGQQAETGTPNAAHSASTFQDAGSSPNSSDPPPREATPDRAAEAEGTET